MSNINPQELLLPLIDRIEEPAIAIDKYYNVICSNKKFRDRYKYEGEKKKCFQISHGYDKPCTYFGVACPVDILHKGTYPEISSIDQTHSINNQSNTVTVNFYPVEIGTNHKAIVLIHKNAVSQKKVISIDKILPLDSLEENYLMSLYKYYDGDNKNLAYLLGVSERTLYRKMSKIREKINEQDAVN